MCIKDIAQPALIMWPVIEGADPIHHHLLKCYGLFHVTNAIETTQALALQKWNLDLEHCGQPADTILDT